MALILRLHRRPALFSYGRPYISIKRPIFVAWLSIASKQSICECRQIVESDIWRSDAKKWNSKWDRHLLDILNDGGFQPSKEQVSPVHDVSSPTTEMEIDGQTQSLCPEQKDLLNLALTGNNVFYTGSAGSGKSTVLRFIKSNLQQRNKRVYVMAPTGKVAMSHNGLTTWSFGGWNPNSQKRGLEDLKKNIGPVERTRFLTADTIIIDEVSMVENHHFERLNIVMRAAHLPHCAKSLLPFGGAQVIVTGDFCQLPPVNPFRTCFECGADTFFDSEERRYKCTQHLTSHPSYRKNDKWAFKSDAWKMCSFKCVDLKENHRQTETKLVDILEKCRWGVSLTENDIQLLSSSHANRISPSLQLYCTRKEVREANERKFKKLSSQIHRYKSLDTFSWNEKDHPYLQGHSVRSPSGNLKFLTDHSFETHLELRRGMRVILLSNLNIDKGLYNGSQGVIVDFYEASQAPRFIRSTTRDFRIFWDSKVLGDGSSRSFEEQQIDDHALLHPTHQPWPVVQFDNGATEVVRPECQAVIVGDSEPHSVISRTQVPLAPGWALSVHKSQGMTLEGVVVNLNRMFADGQGYVALSRVKTMEGLRIEGNPDRLRDLKADPYVLKFMRGNFDVETPGTIENALAKSRTTKASL